MRPRRTDHIAQVLGEIAQASIGDKADYQVKRRAHGNASLGVVIDRLRDGFVKAL